MFQDNPTPTADTLTMLGGSIKAIAPHRYGGYMCKFTSEQRRDLTGEYFAPDTDFMEDLYPLKGMALYHHGLDEELSVVPIGYVDVAEKRADGIYGETVINFAENYKAYVKSLRQPDTWKSEQLGRAAEYQKYIEEMIEDGQLSYSLGALPQGVEVDDNGKIKRWPIIERSLTPTPAEPQFTKVTSLKSLPMQSLRGLATVRGAQQDDATTNEQNKDNHTSKGIVNMDIEQLKQLIQEVVAPLLAALRQEDVQQDEELVDEVKEAAEEEYADDPAMAKSLSKEQWIEKINGYAKAALEGFYQNSKQSELAAAEMIAAAKANGHRAALATQEGKSKVKSFSKDSDASVRKNFNVNLGAEEPTFLDTIKAAMPGASEADKRRSGFASAHNEYVDSIKAQNPYIGPLGGFTVVQELRDQILDPLRPNVIAFDLGVQQTAANGAGAVVLPKMTTAPSAFRPGINTAITGSQAKFDTVTAFLRPIAAEVIIPLQMLQTSMPQAEAKIKEQMVKSIALQIDKEIFIGTGDVESPNTGAGIRGILSLAKNVVDLNPAGRRPGYQDLVNAVTQLSIENVPEDNTNGWAMHPRTRGTFWGMTDAVGQPLWRADVSKMPYPEMVGYKAAVSTQIPVDVPTTDAGRADSSYIFYGRYDMAEYIMAQDLAIFVNPYIYSNQLQVQLLAYTFSDFIVHYNAAFYVIKGVTA